MFLDSGDTFVARARALIEQAKQSIPLNRRRLCTTNLFLPGEWTSVSQGRRGGRRLGR